MSKEIGIEYILAVSGSASVNSSNTRLLKSIQYHYPEFNIKITDAPTLLPLFRPDEKALAKDSKVMNWQESVEKAQSVIICSPEYLHSVPAILKNALEWCTHRGSFNNKKVLICSFTPHPPRGEKLRSHLAEIMKALNAYCVASVDLYQNNVTEINGYYNFDSVDRELIKEALLLL